MPALGITGGIATGKSSLTEALRRLLSAEVFDCDRYARELLTDDVEVKRRIDEQFGSEVFAGNGDIDRARLRQIVFGDITKRRLLEGILHPIIRERWTLPAKKAAIGKHWFMVDIPLLFETKAESQFNVVAVVACSQETQRKRLVRTRKLSDDMARSMISSQLPLTSKIARADHVIWNDGVPATLEQQAELFATYLRQHYG